MAVYKQIRKAYLKRLNKEQRKQIKGYIQDIADEMLEAYSETIRLNTCASNNVYCWLPIAEKNASIHIHIEVKER